MNCCMGLTRSVLNDYVRKAVSGPRPAAATMFESF